MKFITTISFLILSVFVKGQLTADYFPISPSRVYTYRTTFVSDTKPHTSTDFESIVLKTKKDNNSTHFYFSKCNGPCCDQGYVTGIFWLFMTYKYNNLYLSNIQHQSQFLQETDSNLTLLFSEKMTQGFKSKFKAFYGHDIEMTVIGKDSVKIDSTIYLDCIKVQFEQIVDTSKYLLKYAWFCKGIGIIKYEGIRGWKKELIGLREYKPFEYGEYDTLYHNTTGYCFTTKELITMEIDYGGQFSKAVYNKKGLLVKQIYYRPHTDLKVKFITYEYDKSNKLKKETLYCANKQTFLTEFEYDDNGRLIKATCMQNKYDDKYYDIWYYKYDKDSKKFGMNHSNSEFDLKYDFISTDLVVEWHLFSHNHPLRY